MKSYWENYINKTKEMPARPLLVEAMKYVVEKNEALDLGSGALMDSKYLLKESFKHVTAVDNDMTAEDFAKKIESKNFLFLRSKFEDYDFPADAYDLINAQRAIPYISPENFEIILNKIKMSLKKGGIFTGHMFGDRDESINPSLTLTYLTKKQAEDVFLDMDLLKFTETEEDKKSTMGKLKHFHEFEFIARKK